MTKRKEGAERREARVSIHQRFVADTHSETGHWGSATSNSCGVGRCRVVVFFFCFLDRGTGTQVG